MDIQACITELAKYLADDDLAGAAERLQDARDWIDRKGYATAAQLDRLADLAQVFHRKSQKAKTDAEVERLQRQKMIAGEILLQYGGRMFMTMCGVRTPLALESGVQFRIGSGALKGINCVRTVLTPEDEYTVTFYRVSGLNTAVVHEAEHVYAEDLQAVFERHTGFKTKL